MTSGIIALLRRLETGGPIRLGMLLVAGEWTVEDVLLAKSRGLIVVDGDLVKLP
jgi:hypothetical protein